LMGWRRISERVGRGIGKSVAEAISDISDQISGNMRAASGHFSLPWAPHTRSRHPEPACGRQGLAPLAGPKDLSPRVLPRPCRSLTRTRRGFGMTLDGWGQVQMWSGARASGKAAAGCRSLYEEGGVTQVQFSLLQSRGEASLHPARGLSAASRRKREPSVATTIERSGGGSGEGIRAR
jgi:hypothetical protein